MKAFCCWEMGRIGVGKRVPAGFVLLAEGKAARLRWHLAGMARHGKGASEGELLVPGVPEADTIADAVTAIAKFAVWLARRLERDQNPAFSCPDGSPSAKIGERGARRGPRACALRRNGTDGASEVPAGRRVLRDSGAFSGKGGRRR